LLSFEIENCEAPVMLPSKLITRSRGLKGGVESQRVETFAVNANDALITTTLVFADPVKPMLVTAWLPVPAIFRRSANPQIGAPVIKTVTVYMIDLTRIRRGETEYVTMQRDTTLFVRRDRIKFLLLAAGPDRLPLLVSNQTSIGEINRRYAPAGEMNVNVIALRDEDVAASAISARPIILPTVKAIGRRHVSRQRANGVKPQARGLDDFALACAGAPHRDDLTDQTGSDVVHNQLLCLKATAQGRAATRLCRPAKTEEDSDRTDEIRSKAERYLAWRAGRG
jgi:hypothetical protein